MVGFETPTKADDPIQHITTDLSAKWGLRFPPQVLQSPAQRDRKRPEEQVLSRLRFLYFHDKKTNQAATTYAINCFERFAPKLLAGWVVKPRADEDVLPTRTRSGSARRHGFLSTKPTLSDEQASDLMRALLRYLVEAIEGIDKGAIFTIEEEPQEDPTGHRHETPKNQSTQPLRRSSRTSSSKTVRKITNPLKNGNIKAFLTKTGDESLQPLDLQSSKVPPLSSDDYRIDDGIFDDVEMQDVPANAVPSKPSATTKGHDPDAAMGAFGFNDSLEEHYQTPPDSPSKMSTKSSKFDALQASWSPKKIPGQGAGSSGSSCTVIPQGRKRSLPAPSKPDMPRKMSRDASERRFTGMGPVQPVSGFKYIGELEFNKASLENQQALESLQKSWSTESFSSVTSSTATNPFSTFTTPNTSFLTETPATSFDSIAEPYELDHLREKPVRARRSWQNLKAPFGLGLETEVDLDINEGVEFISMGPPAPVARYQIPPDISVKQLLSVSPFDIANPSRTIVVHLRQLYELCRTSIDTKLPLQDFRHCLDQPSDDYESLWGNMAGVVEKAGAAMPEKSSTAAWKRVGRGFEGVALTGSLNFVDQPDHQVFEFKLNPLKIEPSYRLARKFGNDRFLILSIPSIDTRDLPPFLRSDPNAREAILDWLLQSEHSLLGRKWRAFYVKPERNKKGGMSAQNRPSDAKHRNRVYLFAESGHDFQRKAKCGEQDPRMSRHLPMTRSELIEWFMPAKENQNQRALKFFTRLALGVSSTISSVQFKPGQIIRSDDTFANAPARRRLNQKRSHEKKIKHSPVNSELPVMNDGCSRISRRAAKEIADLLHLDITPSIFQGRIAGAKGVWMVDTLDEVTEGPDGDFWIEITDSQLKFEAIEEDQSYPDPQRVTFEVHSYARPLVPASLNFQLMPILADREVPFQVFSNLLEADLTAKVAELEAAMESGLAIRKWKQDVNPVAAERAAHGIEMRGGMPSYFPEQINWFVEHGFEPKDCCRLKDLLYKAIAEYCLRLENRMNIGVAKSTYAFMIADPLAVLEEGEVHIGFSNSFDHELMLHDTDLLVARLPAALPSDVRKVRGVFKLELKSYRDVIVFPSKGSVSLASILSGGDYDGDIAWICWESSIVAPFVNASLPPTPPPHSTYGIETDTTTVSDLLTTHSNEDYTSAFLHHSFSFTLQPNLLGICTAYFDALCYAQNSISHPSAAKIATLLGLLVDRAKAGITFSESHWHDFIQKEGLPRKLPKPAYKDREKGVYEKRKGHLIDRLVFETAKDVRQHVLHSFSKRFKEVGTYDSDLVALYKNEVAESKANAGIALALKELKPDLEKLRDAWSALCFRVKEANADDLSPVKKGSRRRRNTAPIQSFQAVVEQTRAQFLAVRPSEEAMALSPIVSRWARDAFPTTAATSFSSTTSMEKNPYKSSSRLPQINSTITYPAQGVSTAPPPSRIAHWTLLKASYAFYLYYTTTFVWYACGVELGVLKVHARGCRNVVNPIWECLKVDGRAVGRRLAMERDAGAGAGAGAEAWNGDGGGEEDEYGDWEWVEEVEGV